MEDSFSASAESAPAAPRDPSESRAGSASPTITLGNSAGHQETDQRPVSPALKSPARQLPSREINDDTIEDAYVKFILYCNPCISSFMPTIELRRGFNSMPRTDGKSFEAWTLFELVGKLERGELGTWNALVLELGVEKPDLSKGQSGQKVGQYGVRLKRWLHAYHIDAFFQYCLGRPHEYYMNIPTDPKSATTVIRDNVPPDEDLALRALCPNLRPKRGRRREDDLGESPANKRFRAATPGEPDQTPALQPSQTPQSSQPPQEPAPPVAREPSHPPSQPPPPPPQSEPTRPDSYPQSALPAYDHEAYMADVWASAERAFCGAPTAQPPPPPPPGAIPPGYWGGLPRAGAPWGYPYSAVDPHPPPNPLSARDGSQSAHPLAQGTPEKAQRKRPGSSVSAAWRSGSPSTTYKTNRGPGRPPQNRVVYDGSYATFPSHEKDAKKTQQDAPASTPPTAQTPETATSTSAPAQKPNKLSLQVPQHTGGPVRLATPPPKVVVNGSEGGGGEQEVVPQELSGQSQEKGKSFMGFFREIDEAGDTDIENDVDGEDSGVDWKRRALVLGRKLKEARAELKAVKRRVLDAVM